MDAPEAVQVLHDPIILLGMHRSGTSLIATLLDRLGLFQGNELQDDHESVYFLTVNDLILKRIGASWDHPAPIREFLQNPRAMALTARAVRADLSTRRVARFTGLKQFLTSRGISNLGRRWGWKDPRTVFTLPLWLQLFPNARILYIVRNGIDVASSLRAREVRELERRIAEFDRKAARRGSHTLLERAGFKGSARCLTLQGGFSLWEEYVQEAEARLATVPNERMVVRYETFLDAPTHPEHGLATIAKFCGLEVSPEGIKAAVSTINAGRSCAFLSDPELRALYEQVRATHWMKEYGYEHLG